jgi:hypothetical protein
VLAVAGSINLAPALAQSLEVVDTNGDKVGSSDVLGVQERGPIVAFDLDGRVFTLLVTQNSFEGASSLLFTSPNCFTTGTPFLPDTSLVFPSGAAEPALLPAVAVAPPGKTVYLPVPGSPSQSIAIGSVLLSDGTCQAPSQPTTVPAFPAQAVRDLSTQFTPPFQVQFGSFLPSPGAAGR